MHLTGDLSDWNKDAGVLRSPTVARQIGATVDGLVRIVGENVKEKLYFNIVRTLMENEDESLLKGGISKQLDGLLVKSFRQKRGAMNGAAGGDGFMSCRFSTRATLVGIGAPIHIFLPDVAEALDASYVVPETPRSRTPVGAITGNVMAEERSGQAPIFRRGNYRIPGVLVFRKQNFPEHSQAVEWAKVGAGDLAEKSALARGAEEIEISISVDDNEVQISAAYAEGSPAASERVEAAPAASDGNTGGASLLLETLVTARAAGKIKWA